MSRHDDVALAPRNGHTLVMGIVARITGCSKQKEINNEDQVDHAKEELKQLYDGPVEYRTVTTKGKGERLENPRTRLTCS